MLPDGARHSGIYASAYRLLDASNMIALLFSVLLLPIFARMIKQKQSVEELAKLSYTLIITFAIIVAASAFHYSTELMELLYSQHTDETAVEFALRIETSSKVFSLLICCFCAISSTYVFGTLLTANGNLKQLNIIAFSGMILNIGLNLWLIPTMQAYGSAISSLFTQFLVAVIQIFIIKKIFKFKTNYLLISKLAVFLFSMIIINRVSFLLPFAWYVNFLIVLITGVILSFATKLINIRNIIKILQQG